MQLATVMQPATDQEVARDLTLSLTPRSFVWDLAWLASLWLANNCFHIDRACRACHWLSVYQVVLYVFNTGLCLWHNGWRSDRARWRWRMLQHGRVAQWITRLPTEQKIPGSNPGALDEMYFLFGNERYNFSFALNACIYYRNVCN